MTGFKEICGQDWKDARKLVDHPVSCIDCHDPKPPSSASPARLPERHPGAGQSPGGPAGRRSGKDGKKGLPGGDAAPAERRTLRPGQQRSASGQACKPLRRQHAWPRARRCAASSAASATSSTTSRADEQAAHLPVGQGPQGRGDRELLRRGRASSDWTHAETGAAVLKAQHPEFEMWNQGIHARSGVSCADCHMPYKREGAIKISDHHVRSPLLEHQPRVPDVPPLPREASCWRAPRPSRTAPRR